MRKNALSSKNLLLVSLALAVLLMMDSKGYLDGTKNTLMSVLAPVQSRVFSSSNAFGNIFYTLGKINEFKDENARLATENKDLNLKLSELTEVKKENETLKAQLKFKDNLCAGNDCVEFKMGKIIAESSDIYGQSVTINLGSESGARMNQAVTAEGGILIGKVSEVFDDYSKVELIVSPESSINCLAQTTRANGKVQGKYGMGASLEMIDQSEELIPGDVIITSGYQEGIPKGLLIGKINGIEQSPNAVFKSANLDLFADFSHMEEIFLVEPK